MTSAGATRQVERRRYRHHRRGHPPGRAPPLPASSPGAPTPGPSGSNRPSRSPVADRPQPPEQRPIVGAVQGQRPGVTPDFARTHPWRRRRHPRPRPGPQWITIAGALRGSLPWSSLTSRAPPAIITPPTSTTTHKWSHVAGAALVPLSWRTTTTGIAQPNYTTRRDSIQAGRGMHSYSGRDRLLRPNLPSQGSPSPHGSGSCPASAGPSRLYPLGILALRMWNEPSSNRPKAC